MPRRQLGAYLLIDTKRRLQPEFHLFPKEE